MSFYKRIRDLREDADKTQTEIANFLGTTAQYYGKYEKGERELPFSRAVKLADYYNVSLDYLAERTNFRQTRSDTTMSEDEINLLMCYNRLTERNKGKVELFVEQILENQANNNQ